MRWYVLNVIVFVSVFSSSAQDTEKLERIETLQREIAAAMHLKTVFRDASSEKLMYNFWEDSQELVMVGSRYAPVFDWVNRAFCQYLGYTREYLTSTSFMTLIHPDDIEKSQAAFERFQQTGKIGFDTEYFVNRYRHKDGHYLPVYWSHVIINDRDLFLMQASKTRPDK